MARGDEYRRATEFLTPFLDLDKVTQATRGKVVCLLGEGVFQRPKRRKSKKPLRAYAGPAHMLLERIGSNGVPLSKSGSKELFKGLLTICRERDITDEDLMQ